MKQKRLDILLKKLQDGNLTEAEQQELTKMGTHDAFISEALDGLSGAQIEDTNRVIHQLNNRIQDRTSTLARKLWMWGVAAACLVGLIAVGSLLMRDGTMSGDEIAALEQESPPENSYQAQPAESPSSDVATQEMIENSVAEDKTAIQTAPTAKRQAAPEARKKESESREDTGSEATAEDAAQVRRSASGLAQPQTYSADAPPGNQDTMKNRGPGAAVGYALAIPNDGWDSYYAFIRNNIVVPDEVSREGIEGSVFLEFDLDPTGKPTDVRITQSVSPTCDAEAIRLLREGTLWDVENAQVPIGRLRVDF